jgi:DNA-binding phage protein
MKASHTNHRDFLKKQLHDDEFVLEYLNAALGDDNPEVFLLALTDVLKAKDASNSFSKDSLFLPNSKKHLASLGYKLTLEKHKRL